MRTAFNQWMDARIKQHEKVDKAEAAEVIGDEAEQFDDSRIRGPLPAHEQPRVQRITDDQAVRNADKIIGGVSLLDDYAEAKAQ